MGKTISIEWLAGKLPDRTMRGIALETSALIRSGAISVGTHLPPVRQLAQALGVSPATVSGAWGELRRRRVIEGKGRSGVWVSEGNVALRPLRFESVGDFGEKIVADLTYGVPDLDLLPDLSRALQAGRNAQDLNSYRREPIIGSLEQAVKKCWPYQAEAFLAANGGFDGILLALQTLIMPGSVVAIEDPTATRLLDILDNLRVQTLSVAVDENGPIPEALAQALKHKPAAFIYQPRTHTTCGSVVSASRLRDIAQLLEGSGTLIVEDDGLADISAFPAVSLGSYFPARTVHIVSYSKSLGPDLRLAVLSSSKEIVGQIQAYRNFGARWTSRILQEAAAWMLGDTQTMAGIAHARAVYGWRRAALTAELKKRGLSTISQDGLSLWVSVPSEQYALVTLAARGIAVFPGNRFCLDKKPQHIRIGTSLLKSNFDVVADAVALSAMR